jgi:hypothetical protein
MLVWPVLCHTTKLGMEVAGTEMAVSGGHLHRAVTEDTRQVVEVAA